MSGTDPVTFTDLEDWCDEKRGACERLRIAEAKTAALTVSEERRAGMEGLTKRMDAVQADIDQIKKFFTDGKAFFLPRPILYALCGGMVAAGIAGEKIWTALLKGIGP